MHDVCGFKKIRKFCRNELRSVVGAYFKRVAKETKDAFHPSDYDFCSSFLRQKNNRIFGEIILEYDDESLIERSSSERSSDVE